MVSSSGRAQPLRFLRGLLAGLILVGLGCTTAFVVLDGVVGRTHHDCTVTDKRVEKWTSHSNSAWTVSTTCGVLDVGTQQVWTSIEVGHTYTFTSKAFPFEPVRKATLH